MQVTYVDGTVVEADKAILDKEGVTLQQKVQQQGQSKQQNESKQDQSGQKQGKTEQEQTQSKQQKSTHQTIGFVQYGRLRYIVDGLGDQIQVKQGATRQSKKQSDKKQSSKTETGKTESSKKQSSKKQSSKKQSSKKQSSKKQSGKKQSLAIEEMQVNAPGVDDWHKNNEYLVFTNKGSEPLELTDWEVHNEAGDTYRFPVGFDLKPGKTVTLRSGSGDDTDSELYWDSEKPIWRNDSDTITVRNDKGDVVVEESYS